MRVAASMILIIREQMYEAFIYLSFHFIFSVGSEESEEAVECGAAFLFEVFKNVETVGQREATQLRGTFGPYPASAASKACQIVRRIVAWLPDEAMAELNTEREEGSFDYHTYLLLFYNILLMMSSFKTNIISFLYHTAHFFI